jgi:hypothetical protein
MVFHAERFDIVGAFFPESPVMDGIHVYHPFYVLGIFGLDLLIIISGNLIILNTA